MAVDLVLKRHFWAVALVLTGTGAYFGARGLTAMIDGAIASEPAALAQPPAGMAAIAPVSSAPPRVVTSEMILSRNPFDSVTGALNKVEPVEAVEDESPKSPDFNQDPLRAPSCDGVKVLVILASDNDPDWSFAAFAGSDNKPILLRRGADVSGKKIHFIGRDRVWLTQGATLCQTEMWKGSAPPPAAAVPETPVAAASGKPGSVPAEIAQGIRKLSATEFNVERSVVDKILENQAELMKTARVVPENENGKMVGIRLFGIKSESLLGILGMENGDRLQSINGYDISSPEKALEAYARLRAGADKLQVSVTRKGAPVNLDYNIK
jgi:general secretion pathway protein C